MLFFFTRSLVLLLSVFFIKAPPLFSKGNIELREHQSYPGDFLYKRADQKGLLIYHGLGTGKTYLSLDFAEKYPDKNVVILLPRFLKSNWEIQMKSYGIKDRKRYQLVSFRDARPLLNYDFKNTIVIIDEVHKLIDLITSSKNLSRGDYGRLYFKLREAHKILALTGTPIYNSAFDMAYIANLISGKNLLSFNAEKFKENYTKINTGKSFFRGHLMESKLVVAFFPLSFFLTLIPLTLTGTAVALIPPLGYFASLLGIFVGNEAFPAGSVEFRRFDSERLKGFTENYVSFFEVSEGNQEFYPEKDIIEKEVHYTAPQTNMFLDFTNEALDKNSLKTLLTDSNNKNLSDDYLELNSVTIQKNFLQDPTSGREIGNLAIYEPQDEEREDEGIYYPYRVDQPKKTYENTKFIESAKFEEIYEIIQEKPGQVVLYSNYFSNGILQFSHFLDRKGFKNYKILSPDDSVKKQISTINSYNEGKTRILLLHPEITEGVSLQATEQFHLLEPLNNIALQEQVIGRAVRFKSHEKLPEDRRKVSVYLWKSEISYCSFRILACFVPSKAAFIRRAHWQRKYREINPSGWTHGINFVDRNYMRKSETPDFDVEKNSHLVESDMKSFKKLVRTNSIESLKKKKEKG